jgi:DnaJ homolog subfamily C member 28
MFDKIVEDKIHEAMLAGEFDNLPGNGKPLNLDQNPFEAEDWHAANNLLKQNNFTYPWMEKAVEIMTLIEKLRLTACEEWSLVKTNGEKERFAAEYSKKIRALNREILDYNLQVPSQVFQKPVLDPDLELKKITG